MGVVVLINSSHHCNIFLYIYLPCEFLESNKYLLRCYDEICTATDDMRFVLLRPPERSGGEEKAEGKRDCIWKL